MHLTADETVIDLGGDGAEDAPQLAPFVGTDRSNVVRLDRKSNV